MRNIIVAYDLSRAIGRNGQLPWQGELPAELQHFKAVTMGSALIMGRLTHQSIGRPLPGRENIVVSSGLKEVEGCLVAGDLDEAYGLVPPDMDSFVIGGESIYKAALDSTDRIYATEVMAEIGGDRHFPELDADVWCEIDREFHPKDEQNRYDLSFLILEAAR